MKKFPQDFKKVKHNVIRNATRWVLHENGRIVLSVIGGGLGVMGDGVDTFEMMDFRDGEVYGHITADEINKYILTECTQGHHKTKSRCILKI